MSSLLRQGTSSGDPFADWYIVACVLLLFSCCFAYGEVLIIVGIFQVAVAFGALAAGWGLHWALRYYSAGLLWMVVGSAKIFIRKKRHTQYSSSSSFSEAAIEHEAIEHEGEPEAILKAKAILALQAHLEKTSTMGYHEFELVENYTSENSEGSAEDELPETSKSEQPADEKLAIYNISIEATADSDDDGSKTPEERGEVELV